MHNKIIAQLAPGEYTSKNKKAISIFENALKSFETNQETQAIELLNKCLEKDSNFVEARLLLAEIFTSQNNIDAAIYQYKKSLYINQLFDKKTFFLLATLQYQKAQYVEAKEHYESFLKYKTVNPNLADIAVVNLKNCDFAIAAKKNPVPFNPQNMGNSINSNLDEYFPAITADENIFLYTRNNRTQSLPMQEDFLISKKINGQWQKSTLIGSNINTPGNEGAPCLSVDGQLLFYVACEEIDGNYGPYRKGLGSCDIFYTQKVGDKWIPSRNIGRPINSEYYETQPSFSSDGKTLYFVSKKPGGYGSTDIYYSELNNENFWSEPINLGKNINTPGKEESVFIHPDGTTLYFSSDGHPGMGGLDIYMSKKDNNGKWGIPINIGYPINTNNDENSLIVSASGKKAFFASSRKGGYGGLDMYEFDLYDEIKPTTVTYFKGHIFNSKTLKPIEAKFELIDIENASSIATSTANSGNGEFLVTLPFNKDYALNVSYPGYLFYSENFSLKNIDNTNATFVMDIPLQPIDTGYVIELKNIFFETGKYDLKPQSKAELIKLKSFLLNNPTLKAELGGHTDNVGDKKQNQLLSQNRAKAVFDFLISEGINASRISYKGYGDSKPKVKNDSELNRALNRRTEFKITGK